MTGSSRTKRCEDKAGSIVAASPSSLTTPQMRMGACASLMSVDIAIIMAIVNAIISKSPLWTS
jgi:hypothetical protein